MDKAWIAVEYAVWIIAIIAAVAAVAAALVLGGAGLAWIFEGMRGLFPSEGC